MKDQGPKYRKGEEGSHYPSTKARRQLGLKPNDWFQPTEPIRQKHPNPFTVLKNFFILATSKYHHFLLIGYV
jgi:hypothetical protein